MPIWPYGTRTLITDIAPSLAAKPAQNGWVRFRYGPFRHLTGDKGPTEAAARGELEEACRGERLSGHDLLEAGPQEDDPHSESQDRDADLMRWLDDTHGRGPPFGRRMPVRRQASTLHPAGSLAQSPSARKEGRSAWPVRLSRVAGHPDGPHPYGEVVDGRTRRDNAHAPIQLVPRPDCRRPVVLPDACRGGIARPWWRDEGRTIVGPRGQRREPRPDDLRARRGQPGGP